MAQHEPIRKNSGGATSGGSGSSGHPTVRQEIPDKLYFRIGEVAKLCDVPAYVLRFWEAEFPQLRPNKGGTGQRLFRRRDVEMAMRIKTLLYDEGYTIPGARQALKLELRQTKEPQLALGGIADANAAPVDVRHLRAVHKELTELHTLLSKPVSTRSSIHPIRPSKLDAAPRPTPRPAPRVLPRPIDISDAFDSLFDQLDIPAPALPPTDTTPE